MESPSLDAHGELSPEVVGCDEPSFMLFYRTFSSFFIYSLLKGIVFFFYLVFNK